MASNGRLDQAAKTLSQLTGRAREIGDILIGAVEDYRAKKRPTVAMRQLWPLLWPQGHEHHKCFTPGSDERLALEAIITPEEAKLAKAMWDMRPVYPLAANERTYYFGREGHYRICRASSESGLYREAALIDLLNYIGAWLDNFDFKEYSGNLDSQAKTGFTADFFIPRLVAALINKDDDDSERFFSAIRDIAVKDAGLLNADILLGLCMSEKEEALELLMNMLTSSPLQEGFIQNTAGMADLLGHKAFTAIVKLLIDRQMHKNEFVGRLFLIWTGLEAFNYFGRAMGKPLIRPKEAGGYLPQLWQCLTDEKFRENCLTQSEPMAVMLALWAAGAKDIYQAANEAGQLLNSASRSSKMAALFYLFTMPVMPLRFSLIRPLLDRPEIMNDHEMAAWVFWCLPFSFWQDEFGNNSENYHKYYYPLDENVEQPENRPKLIGLTAEEAAAYYQSLKKAVLSFEAPNHSEGFTDSIMPGLEVTYCHKTADMVLTSFLARRSTFADLNVNFPVPAEVKNFNHRWSTDLSFQGPVPKEVMADELDRLEVNIDGQSISPRDDACGYLEQLAPEGRSWALFQFLYQCYTPIQKRASLSLLNDSSRDVRQPAWYRLFLTPLDADDILLLEDFLKDKRKDETRFFTLCKILLALEHRPEELLNSIRRLTGSKNKNQQAAGEEFKLLVMRRSDDTEYAETCRLLQENISPETGDAAKKKPRSAKKTEAKASPTPTSPGPENGQKISSPIEIKAEEPISAPDVSASEVNSSALPLSLPPLPMELNPAKIFGLPAGSEVSDLLSRYQKMREQIKAILDKYKNLSYESRYHELDIKIYAISSVEKTGLTTIGESPDLYPLAEPPLTDGHPAAGLDKYPLAEEWKKIRDAAALPPSFLNFMHPETAYATLSNCQGGGITRWQNGDLRSLPGGEALARLMEFDRGAHIGNPYEESPTNAAMNLAMLEISGAKKGEEEDAKICEAKIHTVISAMASEGDYYQRLRPYLIIIQWLMQYYFKAESELSEACARVISNNFKWLYRLLWPMLNKNYSSRPSEVEPEAWDRAFSHYFKLVYDWNISGAGEFVNLEARSYAQACRLNLLSEIGFRQMIDRQSLGDPSLMGGDDGFSSPRGRLELLAIAPWLESVLGDRISQVVDIEKTRGDVPTEVSSLAASFEYIAGTRHFVDLLELLEGKFDRSNNSRWLLDNTRQSMFCYLLRQTHPTAGEDEKTLRRLIQGRKISERDLIHGALYAPQWINPVARHLGWPGLEKAMWFFYAHVNSIFKNQHDDQLARFSLLTRTDFEDGAFDLAWYRQALAEVGEEHFRLLYDGAKYVADGSAHRRVQMCVDACRGRLKADELLAAVAQKRSRLHLAAYGLLPLSSDDPAAEALERYELFQRFKKESQKFSALKREGDWKAAELAISNLAATCGYDDIDIFIWDMEKNKTKKLMRFTNPKVFGEVELRLAVNSHGGPEIEISKNGRPQKNIPANIRKEAYVAELSEAAKALKQQASRARYILEQAMIEGQLFKSGDIEKLRLNPVVGPILKNIVFKLNDSFVFSADLKERNFDQAIIAHPYHFLKAGNWAKWQRLIFERQIVQPFKQIFREYYPLTAEENGNSIERYKDRAVLMPKGEMLLKTRGWALSRDDGLRKIMRKEGLVVSLGILPDMLSGSDNGCEILNLIFFRRSDMEAVSVLDVPPIILSEALRDVDLLISVAGIGGPFENSAATVEIRRALAAELARLLKLGNITFDGNKILINGQRGQYSIHLGSGLAHKIDRGALHIEAVPRAEKLFLPFADDDPGTSEILSKMLLFADDRLIKDPAILAQLG